MLAHSQHTEYEKQRLIKIEKNRKQVLEKLGIVDDGGIAPKSKLTLEKKSKKLLPKI